MERLLLFLLCQPWLTWSQTVDLSQGPLRGTTVTLQGRTVYSFKGIPYALPPVGERRFKPPEVHTRWPGTFSADSFGPPCPQPSGSRAVRDAMDEDCLHLNVWTNYLPRRGEDGRPRPVVLVFEGQLFTLGNPSDIPAEDFVSDQDIVLVSSSYRLNAFGFLSWENEDLPGNMGLDDQNMAIQWVYDNIDAFGGDRDEISLLGHSAGAASVLFHVMASKSSRHVQRAIMMSGSALAPWAIQPEPRSNAKRLAILVGCTDEDPGDIVRCLQAKDASQLVSAVDDMIRDGNTTALFAPVVDNFLPDGGARWLPQRPEDILRRGAYKKIPMLAGMVTDEGVLMAYFVKENMDRLPVEDIGYFIDNTILPAILDQIPNMANSHLLRQIIRFEYFNPDQTRFRITDDVINFFNHVYFLAPLQRQLLLTAETGGEVYFYTNSYRGGDIFGNQLNRSLAAHGSDLLYLFGPEMYRKFFVRGFESFSEERLARNMKAIFGSFIATGTPIRSLQWDQYTQDVHSYYDLNSNALRRGYRERAYQFWYKYLPDLAEGMEDLKASGEEVVTSTVRPAGLGPLECTTYITFTWLLLAAVVVLIIIFLILLWMMRKTTKKYPDNSHSVFSVSGRSVADDNSFRRGTSTNRRWRESVTDYRL